MRGLLFLLCLALAGVTTLADEKANLDDGGIVSNYAVGPFAIGQELPVSVTLNPFLASLPGTRRWFVIRADYHPSNTPCKGNVNGVDFPFIMFHQIFGQLPGAPDYRKGSMMYDNITVIEEKVDGNMLNAKLKINGPVDPIVGRVKLVCIFVDHPPASIAEGMRANVLWHNAYTRAKPVYDLLDQKAKLTPEQRKALSTEIDAVYAPLRAEVGLPTELRNEKFQRAEYTIRMEHGISLTPEQQQAIAEERKTWDELKQKANYYTAVWTSIVVQPQQ